MNVAAIGLTLVVLPLVLLALPDELIASARKRLRSRLVEHSWATRMADWFLFLGLVIGSVLLSLDSVVTIGVTFGLSSSVQMAVIAVLLVAMVFVVHAHVAETGATVMQLPRVALTMASLIIVGASARDESNLAPIVMPLVLLLGLPVVASSHGGESRRHMLILVMASAFALVCGGASAVLAESQILTRDPALVRIALVLLLIHVGLISAAIPGHLWAHGLSESARSTGMALLLGMGGLAGTMSFISMVEHYPWLLRVAGTRAVLIEFGIVSLLIALVNLIGERRPARWVISASMMSAGIVWLTLASGAQNSISIGIIGLIDRSIGIAVALLGLDALTSTISNGRLPGLSRRLIGNGGLAFWIGVATLIGIPITTGSAARWLEIAALSGDRAPLAIIVIVAMAIAIGAVARPAISLMVSPVLARSDELSSTRFDTPGIDRVRMRRKGVMALVLAGGIVFFGLFPNALFEMIFVATSSLGN